MNLIAPSSTFQEHTVYVATVFWFLGDCLMGCIIKNFEFEAQSVNSNDVLSGIVLQHAGDKCLWEEESWKKLDQDLG